MWYFFNNKTGLFFAPEIEHFDYSMTSNGQFKAFNFILKDYVNSFVFEMIPFDLAVKYNTECLKGTLDKDLVHVELYLSHGTVIYLYNLNNFLYSRTSNNKISINIEVGEHSNVLDFKANFINILGYKKIKLNKDMDYNIDQRTIFDKKIKENIDF